MEGCRAATATKSDCCLAQAFLLQRGVLDHMLSHRNEGEILARSLLTEEYIDLVWWFANAPLHFPAPKVSICVPVSALV